MTSTFFITFAFSFLIFYDMLLIFISCIISLNFSRRRIVVIMTILISKSFVFNIFLFFSKITLNTINFLNFCSVIATSNSRINIIISFAFIFFTCFIFWVLFIHVIFLLSFRLNNALMTRATNVKNVILRFSAATFASMLFLNLLLILSIFFSIFL